jgi:hypothetical protein
MNEITVITVMLHKVDMVQMGSMWVEKNDYFGSMMHLVLDIKFT